jgi:hypothetical protein
MFFYRKKIKAIILLLFIAFFFVPINNNAFDSDTLIFPVPPQTNAMLFYIQRSTNINTIVYDVNITNGKIDPDKALNIYWLRYTDKGQRGSLNYLERVLAYGADAIPDKNNKGVYTLQFAASKKRTATFFLDDKGQAIAFMTINGKKARLNKIFVQAEETSWLPKVKYVDIIGSDLQTGIKEIERIFP